MNKNKVLILGFIVILTACFGFYNTAKATSPSIYISPTSADHEVGDTFDISININPDGEKTCMVEGKVVLDKLSCQSVSLTDNVMASPDNKLTCDNLYFSLGIPRCTTSNKKLFTVTVKAKKAGTGTISFTGVNIIGEGISISSASSGGNYTITSIPSCDCNAWSSWQDGLCGDRGCSSVQKFQDRTRTCTPSGCSIERETRCAKDSSCLVVIGEEDEEGEEGEIIKKDQVKTPVKKGKLVSVREMPKVSLLASLGDAFKGISQSFFLMIIMGLCLIGLIAIGIKEWKLFQKRKEK